jgi:hypothetical protein
MHLAHAHWRLGPSIRCPDACGPLGCWVLRRERAGASPVALLHLALYVSS